MQATIGGMLRRRPPRSRHRVLRAAPSAIAILVPEGAVTGILANRRIGVGIAGAT
jgi:hypothetical protein